MVSQAILQAAFTWAKRCAAGSFFMTFHRLHAPELKVLAQTRFKPLATLEKANYT